jgi:hypothetical protein
MAWHGMDWIGMDWHGLAWGPYHTLQFTMAWHGMVISMD